MNWKSEQVHDYKKQLTHHTVDYLADNFFQAVDCTSTNNLTKYRTDKNAKKITPKPKQTCHSYEYNHKNTKAQT